MNIAMYRIGKETLKDTPADERYPIFLQKVELMTCQDNFIKDVFEFGIIFFSIN